MGDFKGKGKRVKVKEMGKSSIFHMCRLRKAVTGSGVCQVRDTRLRRVWIRNTQTVK